MFEDVKSGKVKQAAGDARYGEVGAETEREMLSASLREVDNGFIVEAHRRNEFGVMSYGYKTYIAANLAEAVLIISKLD